MVTEILANYIGCEDRSFKNKEGEEVNYRKLNFLCHGEQSPFAMSVRSDCELLNISPFEQILLMIEWRYNTKSGFWNPKIIKVISGKEKDQRLKRVDVGNPEIGKVISNG